MSNKNTWSNFVLKFAIEIIKHSHFSVIGEYLEKQETIFKMALEELEGDMKERFLLLAIFNGDVNIMPKVSWKQK